MKNLLLSLLALMTVGVVSAQTSDFNRHEISVGYGVATITDIGDLYANVFSGLFTGQTGDLGSASYSGAINADYNYRLTKTIGVGAAFAYEHSTNNILVDKSTSNGKSKANYIAIMPMVKFNWINKGIFTLYSKVAVGAQFEFCKQTYGDKSESKTYTYFAFQASPVGIELGRKVCGFAELGVGQQGIAQLGVKYKF